METRKAGVLTKRRMVLVNKRVIFQAVDNSGTTQAAEIRSNLMSVDSELQSCVLRQLNGTGQKCRGRH